MWDSQDKNCSIEKPQWVGRTRWYFNILGNKEADVLTTKDGASTPFIGSKPLSEIGCNYIQRLLKE